MYRGKHIIFFGLILILTLGRYGRCELNVDKLLSLLDPVPSKGSPFPQIPGPGRQDKVCIVGAGPAGIDMALKLKKLGYGRIKILEKTNRVGGKSFDIKYKGIVHPQGTIFLEGNHFENLIPLAEEYNARSSVRPLFLTLKHLKQSLMF